MFEISKRKVTKAEAELLVREIKLTPNIMGYSLTEWMSAEYIIVAEDENGNMGGACLNMEDSSCVSCFLHSASRF
ncbi:MAG: hypothetical protein HCA26_26560 [Dolichospermum sp. DET66]|nr:hypothetical protein [Dolichospermum sp. DET66]